MTSRNWRTTGQCSSMVSTHEQMVGRCACEDAEVICVRKVHPRVLCRKRREEPRVGSREVPYPSGVLALVGDAGIEDEASSRAHPAAPGRCSTPCAGRGQGGRPGLEHDNESMVVVRDT
jgi:hypothetical protein